jgi:hypothetical protein
MSLPGFAGDPFNYIGHSLVLAHCQTPLMQAQ